MVLRLGYARDGLDHLSWLWEVWRLALVEPFAPHFLEAVLLPWAYAAVKMHLPVF